MTTIVVPADVTEKMVWIARSNPGAHREVVRVYVYLERLEMKLEQAPLEFWNIRDSASGWLESCATLNDGTPIWRLYPTHVHCIAFLAERDGDLLVLDVSSKAEVETTETQLIINCCC
jgi:hypothetical protein